MGIGESCLVICFCVSTCHEHLNIVTYIYSFGINTGNIQIRIYVILHNRINVYRAFLTYIYGQGIRAIAETGDHILSIAITNLS